MLLRGDKAVQELGTVKEEEVKHLRGTQCGAYNVLVSIIELSVRFCPSSCMRLDFLSVHWVFHLPRYVSNEYSVLDCWWSMFNKHKTCSETPFCLVRFDLYAFPWIVASFCHALNFMFYFINLVSYLWSVLCSALLGSRHVSKGNHHLWSFFFCCAHREGRERTPKAAKPPTKNRTLPVTSASNAWLSLCVLVAICSGIVQESARCDTVLSFFSPSLLIILISCDSQLLEGRHSHAFCFVSTRVWSIAGERLGRTCGALYCLSRTLVLRQLCSKVWEPAISLVWHYIILLVSGVQFVTDV